MHCRSFASEGTLPKATRRERKRVRGNAEAWVSTLQYLPIYMVHLIVRAEN